MEDRVLNRAPALSIIVVSMNRKEMLERCLLKLGEQSLSDYEIIVVDNASTDGTEDLVRTRFPLARYERLEPNLGPPGGRNCGLRMAFSDMCVFLDDDAYFEDRHALARINECFVGRQELAVLAFRIVNPQDGREEYKSIPRSDKRRINRDYECSYFCGAGFALRRGPFVEAGMFWERLFFTGEELDISFRLMNRGGRMIRMSAVSVVHDETPQARIPGRWIYYGTRSRLWIALRNLPWRFVVSHTVLWWGYYFVMAVKNRHLAFFIGGVRDALKGIGAVLPERSPVSRSTIDRLKTLSGRIYY